MPKPDPEAIKKAEALRKKALKQRREEIARGDMDAARDSSAAGRILKHFLRRNG